MECPTIAVHAEKCYKALTGSEAVIPLSRQSTYQIIDSSFKIPIQATTTKLNMADGSPITALRNNSTPPLNSRFQIHP